MRPLALSQVAGWCDARLLGGDARIVAVDIDSRAVRRGALFVALPGERHDGHDHAAAALAAGAAAVLCERPLDLEAPQLVCGNTRLALARLAAGLAAGRRSTVVAITGSNGKTTVKTLVHAILSPVASAYANPGNRNNEIGLPLAVIEQPEDARFGIYEMGAGQPGDIAYLTDVVRPDVALVNNVAAAHLERMGSLLGVAETKGAIYAALRPGGTAVINADDAFAPWFEDLVARSHAARAPATGAGAPVRLLRFGLEASAEVYPEDLAIDPESSRFTLVAPQGRAAVVLPLPGRHNVANALAAASIALAAGATLAQVAEGLAAAPQVAGRLVRHQLPDGTVLIDDSYNANPGSVAAAIATLSAQATAGRTAWLVLGDMRELGADGERLHGEAGERARSAGIARLFTVGPLSAAASRAFGAGAQHFDSQDGLLEALRAALSSREGAPVACLVKGSRGSAMERVIAGLLPTGANDAGGASHVA